MEVKARLQELSLFYDRRFDCAPAEASSPYTLKLNYTSPHSMTRDAVRAGSKVLDLGCAGGYMGAVLKDQKQCHVTGMDVAEPVPGSLDAFQIHDLNSGVPSIPKDKYDVVLLLDVVEHLTRPEAFLEELRQATADSRSIEIIISTGNVAFVITRLMLLAGQFNCGKRGILDVTHTRLFTFSSLRRALEQAGFEILETKGVPGPFPLAIGDNAISRFLLAANSLMIRCLRGLFSYQIFMRVKPRPCSRSLLRISQERSSARAAQIETTGVDVDKALR